MSASLDYCVFCFGFDARLVASSAVFRRAFGRTRKRARSQARYIRGPVAAAGREVAGSILGHGNCFSADCEREKKTPMFLRFKQVQSAADVSE